MAGKIGDAEVTIHGDGGDLNKDIVKAFDSSAADVDRAGEEHGERYGTKFSDGFRERFESNREKIAAGLRSKMGAEGSEAGAFSGSETVKRFTAVVKDKLGDTSSALTEGITEAFKGAKGDASARSWADRLTGIVRERAVNSLAGLLDVVDPAQQSQASPISSPSTTPSVSGNSGEKEALRLAKIQYRLQSTLHKLQKSNAASLANQKIKGEIRFNAIEKANDADALKRVQRLGAERLAGAKAMLRYYRESDDAELKRVTRLGAERLAGAKAMLKYYREMDEAREKRQNAIEDQELRFDAILSRAREKSQKDEQAFADKLGREKLQGIKARAAYEKALSNRTITVRGESIDTTSIKKIQAMLGEGSRNNFLNSFGKSAGGVLRLTSSIGSASKSLFTSFKTGFKSAEEGASLLTKTMSGLSQAGSDFGSGLSGAISKLVASGPLGAAAIGVVVFALSALASVASAAVAALVALASTIASGLAGALLAVTGLFAGVVAAAGLAVVAFKNLSDAQKGLLKNSFAPVKKEVSDLGKIVAGPLSQSFRTWGKNVTAAVKLATPVAEVMGKAFGKAGETLTKSLSGPGFKAFSKQLAVYLPNIVEKLSTGLGGFLNGLTGTFAALTPLASRFADYLGDLGTRFSKFVNTAEGQNKIKDFADRAIVSLKSLAGFLKQAGGFISDLLFNPQSQAAGNSIFDSLTRSFEGFRAGLNDGSLKKWFEDAIAFGGDLKELIKGLADAFRSLSDSGTLSAIGDGLRVVGNLAEGAAKPLKAIVDIIGGISEALDGLFSGDFSKIGDGLKRSLGGLGTLALGPVRLLASGLGKVGGAAVDAGKKLLGIGGGSGGGNAVFSALSKGVDVAIAANSRYEASLNQVTGAITKKTRAQILDNAGASDVLAVAGRMGISQKDLVGAISGNEKAISRVNKAYFSGKGNIEAYTAEGSKLTKFLNDNKVALADQQTSVRNSANASKNFRDSLANINAVAADLPRDLKVAVATQGTKVSRNELDSIRQMFPSLTNKQLKIIVREFGTKGAKSALKGLENDANRTGKVRPRFDGIPAGVRDGVNRGRKALTGSGIPALMRNVSKGAKPNLNPFVAGFGAAGKNAKNRITAAGIPGALRNTTRGAKPNMNPFIQGIGMGMNQGKGRIKGANIARGLVDSTRGARPNMNPFIQGINAQMNVSKQRIRAANLDKTLRDSTQGARANLGPFNGSIQPGLSGAKSAASAGGREVGGNLQAGVIAGFAGTASALASAASAAVGAALAAAKARAKSRSPSREMMKIGNDLGRGLVIGQDQQRGAAAKAGERLAGAALDAAAKRARKGGKGGGKPAPKAPGGDPFDLFVRGGGPKSTGKIAKAFRATAKSLDKDFKSAMAGVGIGPARQALASVSRSLTAAIKKATPAVKRTLTRFAGIVAEQSKSDSKRVAKLVASGSTAGATIADLADARGKLAKKLADANTALTNAITLRNDYRTTVTEAARNFALLTTAVGQTVNGVEQAVSSGDIVSNLRARYAKIKKYGDDLKVLLNNGLSNAAYKQLTDAGVDAGGAYVDALVKGAASGDIGEVNGLVDNINALTDQLGIDTSDRLYQAGVDAAQGLVNGLESLNAKLAAAATRLGNNIAKAIRKALGIKSPSRVLRRDMGYAGDGLSKGLDDQTPKVANAAARLAKAVSVNPRVRSEFASLGAGGPVSGNSTSNTKSTETTHHHQWNVTTSGDPEAAAKEMVNEFTGRIE